VRVILGKAQALSFPVILNISSSGEGMAWEVKCVCPRCLETEVRIKIQYAQVIRISSAHHLPFPHSQNLVPLKSKA